jgi:cell wall-associated NlpC family hydrolase
MSPNRDRKPTRLKSLLSWTALATALSVLLTGCASTGAVPRPFPMPQATKSPTTLPVPPAPSPEPMPAPSRAEIATPAEAYAIVGTALELRGVPYRNGGADLKGFDCSGFTQYVFAQHGVSLPRAVRDQFSMAKQQVTPNDLEPGDLLFFTTTEPGASHVAIAVGGNEFIHAPSSTGVVRVERLSARYWADRFVGARRITRP